MHSNSSQYLDKSDLGCAVLVAGPSRHAAAVDVDAHGPPLHAPQSKRMPLPCITCKLLKTGLLEIDHQHMGTPTDQVAINHIELCSAPRMTAALMIAAASYHQIEAL